MTAHRVPATVLATVLAAAGLLAGCATPAPPVPPPATPPVPASAVALPWPSGAQQQAVDGGSQPWLLDPTEVALAYAAAAHNWAAAQAVTSADGTVVDLTGPDGTRRTLTLARPAGPTGIWLVVTDTPTP